MGGVVSVIQDAFTVPRLVSQYRLGSFGSLGFFLFRLLFFLKQLYLTMEPNLQEPRRQVNMLDTKLPQLTFSFWSCSNYCSNMFKLAITILLNYWSIFTISGNIEGLETCWQSGFKWRMFEWWWKILGAIHAHISNSKYPAACSNWQNPIYVGLLVWE